MKSKPAIVLGLVAALPWLSSVATAQAPSAIAGSGLLISITYGTYPLASYGYSLMLPANSGNSYQSIAIYGVMDFTGTYTYTRMSAMTARMSIYSSATGNGVATVGFTTSTSGTFDYVSTTYPGLSQGGTFLGATETAPSALAGQSIHCTVSDGRSPFASSGSFTLTTAPTGNTYTIVRSGGGANSSGTYSYSVVNRSTGALQINDLAVGIGTAYIGFSHPTAGFCAIKLPSAGFQTASFVIPDTTRPTVSISNPASAQTYTNAQTLTITATASDNVGVTSVEFYDGGALKGIDLTAPHTCDWSFSAADNGAHVWTACAYDAAGNLSNSSPVTLTVNIDITPPVLTLSKQGTNLVLNWPTNTLAFALQWSTNLGTATWSNAIPAPAIVDGQYTVTNNMTNKARFYRLKQ